MEPWLIEETLLLATECNKISLVECLAESLKLFSDQPLYLLHEAVILATRRGYYTMHRLLIAAAEQHNLMFDLVETRKTYRWLSKGDASVLEIAYLYGCIPVLIHILSTQYVRAEVIKDIISAASLEVLISIFGLVYSLHQEISFSSCNGEVYEGPNEDKIVEIAIDTCVINAENEQGRQLSEAVSWWQGNKEKQMDVQGSSWTSLVDEPYSSLRPRLYDAVEKYRGNYIFLHALLHSSLSSVLDVQLLTSLCHLSLADGRRCSNEDFDLLLQLGADPNKPHPEHGLLLQMACSRNDAEAVSLILRHGGSGSLNKYNCSLVEPVRDLKLAQHLISTQVQESIRNEVRQHLFEARLEALQQAEETCSKSFEYSFERIMQDKVDLDYRIIRDLLFQDVKVDLISSGIVQLFYVAVALGDEAFVNLMLSRGVDPRAKIFIPDLSPFMRELEEMHLRMEGVRRPQFDRPTQAAASGKHKNVVRVLLRRAEERYNLMKESDASSFFLGELEDAVRCQDMESVTMVLSRERPDLSSSEEKLQEIMGAALAGDCLDIVLQLEEIVQTNPLTLTNPLQWTDYCSDLPPWRPIKPAWHHLVSEITLTPLEWSAWTGNKAMTEHLISKSNIDYDADNPWGISLDLAASNGQLEVLGYLIQLLQSSMDKSTTEDEISSALLWALKSAHNTRNRNQRTLIELLLTNGARLSLGRDADHSELLRAFWIQKTGSWWPWKGCNKLEALQVFETLCTFHLDVSTNSEETIISCRQTMLEAFCATGSSPRVATLLETGVRPTDVALKLAQENGHDECGELLVSYDASLESESRRRSSGEVTRSG